MNQPCNVNADRGGQFREKLLWLAIIFTVALAVRAVHLNQLSAAPFFGCRIGDAQVYDQWGREIAVGNWVGDRVFYQAPLYPYFLGTVYSLLGDDFSVVLKVQAVLGSLSCVLLALAGWQLFTKQAGIAAGLLLSLYGPAMFYESLLQKSALDVFLLSLSLWLISGLVTAPTKGRWWGLGMSLGALVLARENALVFVAAILLWIAVRPLATNSQLAGNDRDSGRKQTRWRRWTWASCFVLGLALMLFPVALRNKLVGGEFHLTTSQLGPNLYIGNHPGANGTYAPLRFGRGHARYERDDATAIAESAAGRKLAPSEVSSFYVGRVANYVRSQPGNWLRLMARKVALTWNADELVDTEDPHTYAEWSAPLRWSLSVLHFGVLAPLAVFGAAVTRRRRGELWIFYLMIAVYTASVAIFFVFGRYRLPLVPLLILFAAGGVTDAILRWRGRTKWRLAACCVLLVPTGLLCNLRLVSTENMQAITYNNLGNALATQGKFDEAIGFYARSLNILPDNALTHNNLGVALAHQGQHQLASEHYQTALQIEPAYDTARRNLTRLPATIEVKDASGP